jgi:hypothetical protein
MKKVILILGLVSTALFSCKKENPQPNQSQQDCNCGVVVAVSHWYNGDLRNITVKNNCSNNTTTLHASHTQGLPGWVGATYCRSTPW